MRDFITGHGAGGKLAFEQANDVALGQFLPGEQRFGFAGGIKIEPRRPHTAAGLPRGGNKIPTRGFGKLVGLGDALAALAGGFNRNVPRHSPNPRRRRGGVVGGRETDGRIGALARGDMPGLRRRPLRPRFRQGGLVIKRDERERIEAPRMARPRAGDAVRFEESLQTRVGERTTVERSGGFFR